MWIALVNKPNITNQPHHATICPYYNVHAQEQKNVYNLFASHRSDTVCIAIISLKCRISQVVKYKLRQISIACLSVSV